MSCCSISYHAFQLWKRVIHGDAFAQAHLLRAGYGLLISTCGHNPRIVMAAIQGGGIEVSELRKQPESMDMVKVKASCNGLVLVFSGSYAPYVVTFVVNPSTKCCFKLPTFRCFNGTLCYFGIAYAAASMKYKVVATYRSKRNSMLARCKVLTLGVDNTWRRVPTKQLSPKANVLLCAHPLATGYPVFHDPLITEGHMHWAPWLLENDVLTLDIETEVFVETPAPLKYQIYGPQYHYRSTGSHLSVLICCGYLLWKVWEMRGGSGEWRNVLPDIDLNAHKSEILQLGMEDDDNLWPIGWVNYPEVLLFSFCNPTLYDVETSSCGIIYNLDGDEINSVVLPEAFECCEAVVHKNSLVVMRRDLF